MRCLHHEDEDENVPYRSRMFMQVQSQLEFSVQTAPLFRGPASVTEPCSTTPCSYPKDSCCGVYKAKPVGNSIVCAGVCWTARRSLRFACEIVRSATSAEYRHLCAHKYYYHFSAYAAYNYALLWNMVRVDGYKNVSDRFSSSPCFHWRMNFRQLWRL